jgi:hypothetical protein
MPKKTKEGSGSPKISLSDYLPIPQESEFIPSNEIYVEMLVRISEILGEDSELRFNKAIFKLPLNLYGRVKRRGINYEEIK